MKVDERVDDPRKKRVVEEARPPTKKLCSCGADLSSLSVYHVRKHLAGSNHLKVQAASGLRALTFTKTETPVVQRPCAELKWR